MQTAETTTFFVSNSPAHDWPETELNYNTLTKRLNMVTQFELKHRIINYSHPCKDEIAMWFSLESLKCLFIALNYGADERYAKRFMNKAVMSVGV